MTGNGSGRHRHMGSAVMGLVFGVVAAILGGVVWAGIVTGTGYEVGYVAWGVGLIVGLAVAAGSPSPGVGHGLTAAGLAAAGLLLGKVLIYSWAMPGLVAKEFSNDPEMSAAAIEVMVARDPSLDPELKAWYDNQDPAAYTEEQDNVYIAKLNELITTRAAQMSEDEHKAAVKDFANLTLAALPMETRMSIAFSPWDLLWFGLALFTAFRIGCGATGNPDS